MDRKTQETLFQGSVDLDELTKRIDDLIEMLEEIGNPKRLKIEIRQAKEFDGKLSPEEIIEQIDREITKINNPSSLDIFRVWKQDDYYAVVGAKIKE